MAKPVFDQLEARAAAVLARSCARAAPTYLESVLLAEIDKALGAGNRQTLAALDRVREATALPQDPRVARELRIEALKVDVLARMRGAA